MINKLKTFWDLLHRGREIANADDWINHGITANKVSVFILSLVAALKAFGIDLPVDSNNALLVGGGIIGVANIVLGTVTTHKAGLSIDEPDTGVYHPIVTHIVPKTEQVPPIAKTTSSNNSFDDLYKG